MAPEITSFTFICDVKARPRSQHLMLQIGDAAIGLTVQLILTPEQAETLAKNLQAGATAVRNGEEFVC